MGLGGLLLDRLQRLSPNVRAIVYDVVLLVAGARALLAWGLPLVDVDSLGPIDLSELGSIAIAAAGCAALLARANTPTTPPGGDRRSDDATHGR